VAAIWPGAEAKPGAGGNSGAAEKLCCAQKGIKTDFDESTMFYANFRGV